VHTNRLVAHRVIKAIVEDKSRRYHEFSQSRYKSHIKWATTCTISSPKDEDPKDEDLKLEKKEGINATEDALIGS